MRPRKRTSLVCYSLEPDILAWVAAVAAADRKSRSQVIREVLLAAMKRRPIP